MLSLLIYLFVFILLFCIAEKQFKVVCFSIICLLSLQLIFSYHISIGSFDDILLYLVILSFIDLLMVFCIIIKNFIIKDYQIIMSVVAILSVFATLFSIFDYYNYYYLQYAPMIVMEYLYFSIKQQPKFNILYYTTSILLVVPHIIT